MVRAGRRILVSVAALDMITAGEWLPYVTADGDVLRIDDGTRRYVYRITGKCARLNAYAAEWPD